MTGSTLVTLTRTVRGQVLTPTVPAYEQTRRVFYANYDHSPGAIVRAETAEDVARTLTWAADTETEVAIRGGGHSPAGHGSLDGGVVIDLSGMKALDIDPVARTAWAQAGLTTGEVTAAAGVHGLAVGFGDTPSVGIGGITLAGGIGFLARKHGLTIDNLLAAEVVTADGRVLRADPDTNADLFWAIRGGGGNFGVATRFLFRLQEVHQVVGGMMVLPATPEIVAEFMVEADAAPDDLSAIANLMIAPPAPFLPEEVHGRLVLMILLAHVGDLEAGSRAVQRLRSLAEPLVDMVGPTAYPELFQEPDGAEGYHPLGTSHNLFRDSFGVAEAKHSIERLEASTAMASVIQLRVLGGAVARVPNDATAFGHRHRNIMVNVGALYTDPDQGDTHARWAEDTAVSLKQGEDGAYGGFLSRSEPRRVYPPATLDRLRQVKRRYDPDNVFRLNQNVRP